YPFGARHLRSNQAQSVNRYKYNGHEEQRTGGLGYLDYGARMYDAALSRWFSIDPLAEQYAARSVYHFCGNNPLLPVDGNGMSYWEKRYVRGWDPTPLVFRRYSPLSPSVQCSGFSLPPPRFPYTFGTRGLDE
ncbi:RHS repeat-associated core domain-containing protein, partial [Bacteroides heparinolyticus]|uniref:RHS repeat-associated core domain-containing protein n=1 Tax=Prevotella heparinolytica TaxID=28113 RepID=UPI0035A18E07